MPESTDWKQVAEAMHNKLREIPCTCIETEECAKWYKSANDYAHAQYGGDDKMELAVHRLMWMLQNSVAHEDHYITCTRCDAMYMWEQASDQAGAARVS
jgi:hypothetical protein